MAEIVGDRGVISRHEDAQKNQPKQRQRFRAGENVLNEFAKAHALHVQEGDEDHHHDADELLHRKADGVFRAERDRLNHPSCAGDRREKHAEIASESDGDRGDRAGLNDEKERPAVEKSPERRIRFAQINVLPAGVRKQRREFAVGKRGSDRQQSGDDPGEQQAAGRAGLARDVATRR